MNKRSKVNKLSINTPSVFNIFRNKQGHPINTCYKNCHKLMTSFFFQTMKQGKVCCNIFVTYQYWAVKFLLGSVLRRLKSIQTAVKNEASLKTFKIKLTPKGSLVHVCNPSIHSTQDTKRATDWLKAVWIFNFSLYRQHF